MKPSSSWTESRREYEVTVDGKVVRIEENEKKKVTGMVCFCSVQPTIRPGAIAMVSMLRSIGDLYCEMEDLQDRVMKSPSWPVTFMHAINMPRFSLPGESGTSNTILIL